MAFSKIRILSIKLGAKTQLIKRYWIVLSLVFFSIFNVNNSYAVNVGDSFAGGTVFCVSQTADTTQCVTTGSGCYGLIMANVDQVNYNSNSKHGVRWSSVYSITGATSDDNGAVNTATIIAALPRDTSSNNAAWVCHNYTGGRYTDWYLPAKNELNKMYTYAKANNLIGGSCTGSKAGGVQCLVGGWNLSSKTYWSSTEYSSGGNGAAWRQYFSYGNQYFGGDKVGDYFGVRAVRAFNHLTIQLFNNLHKYGYEDVAMKFTETDFINNFSSACSSLTTIKITGLPTHGTLKLSSEAVSLNQEIPINSIVNLTYTPNAWYVGSDSFSWNGSNGVGYAPNDANVEIAITENNNTSSSISSTEPFSSSSSSLQTLGVSSSRGALSLSSSPATNHDSSWIIPAIVVPSVTVGAAITTAVGFILYRHGVLSCFRKEGMSAGVEMGAHDPSTTFRSILPNVESTAFQSTLSSVAGSVAESVDHFSSVEMGTHESSTAFKSIFTNG